MQQIKLGFIGAGGITGSHIKGFEEIEGVEIVGFFDIDHDQARTRAEETGATAFPDLDALLGADLDAVSITTPTPFHAQGAVAALQAGKHVFTEKPMAHNAAEAESMVQAADESSKLLMVGYNYRFDPKYRALGELFHSGELGRLVAAFDRQWISRPEDSWAEKRGARDEWRLSQEQSGGRMFEFGSHKAYWLQWLGGEPVSVYGLNDMVAPALREVGVDDYVMAVLNFPEGNGVLEVGMLQAAFGNLQVGIVGTEGEAKLAGNTIHVRHKDGCTREFEAPPCKSRFEEFIEAIREDRKPEVDGRDGLLAQRVLEAHRRSLETGQVEVP